MRFHKLTPSVVIVLYDELDLAPGKIRVKVGGGTGGHNGIKSLDAHLGKDYRRVRIGIGHPGPRNWCTTMCWAISPRRIQPGSTLFSMRSRTISAFSSTAMTQAS